MEPTERFEIRLEEFDRAFDDFEALLKRDLSSYDDQIADGETEGSWIGLTKATRCIIR